MPIRSGVRRLVAVSESLDTFSGPNAWPDSRKGIGPFLFFKIKVILFVMDIREIIRDLIAKVFDHSVSNLIIDKPPKENMGDYSVLWVRKKPTISLIKSIKTCRLNLKKLKR